ncbi:hypothetical protein, partial [Clostridium perfringens]
DLHPSPFGQQLYFEAIKRLLEDEFKRPVPVRLTSVKLPRPAEALNYERGAYTDVHRALTGKGFHVEEAWKPTDQTPTREGFVNIR